MKIRSQKGYIYIVCLFLLFSGGSASNLSAQAPVPVFDKKHNKWSAILMNVQQASTIINARVVLVVNNIRKAQEFVSKAHTVVNGVVKNVRMVNQLIQIEQDIAQLVQTSIAAINEPRDTDLDGIDDLYYLDKWKHIQILLAIGGQADGVFELFKNVIEDDTHFMDDKGRLTIIKDAYLDARNIKTAIRVQIRRINQEIYRYKIQRREVIAFERLFQ